MNKLVFSILFFSVFSVVYSQKPRNPHDINYAVKYQKQASFEGGIEKLSEILREGVSNEILNSEEVSILELSIEVLPDGSVRNIEFLRPFSSSFKERVIVLFKDLRFKPAEVNGFKITQNLILSIPLY